MRKVSRKWHGFNKLQLKYRSRHVSHSIYRIAFLNGIVHRQLDYDDYFVLDYDDYFVTKEVAKNPILGNYSF